MPYLDFVSDAVLKKSVNHVLEVIAIAESDVEKKLYKNVIDPFSAVFDASSHGMTLDQWLVGEKARQIQKTMQNEIGTFHQKILGSMRGWEDLGMGHVIDVCNREKKIIAEVKNKFNTTKGNHKVAIYNDIEKALTKVEYEGFIGYYVEIISKATKDLSKRRYDKPFTPSDNTNNKRRPSNERIRIIDGRTFYDLATGKKDSLKLLYQALPKVIADLTGEPTTSISTSHLFTELFNKAF